MGWPTVKAIVQQLAAQICRPDVRSQEEYEETLALLKILALGSREIEPGYFRVANDVFAELDKEDAR